MKKRCPNRLVLTNHKPLQLALLISAAVITVGCVGPVNETANSDKKQQSPDSEAQAHEMDLVAVEQIQVQAARLAYTSDMTGNSRTRTTLNRTPQLAETDAYTLSQRPAPNTENYQKIDSNGVFQVNTQPVSTFSVDVDTGSYTNSRRMLNNGQMPPADAVRIEEFINYFDYDYASLHDESRAFSFDTAVSVSPWNDQRHLLRIGIKGYEDLSITKQGRNLVFLLDVSGSMNQSNKLPLLKRSLSMLTQQLDENDTVSIVVYAGASGVVLEPTSGADNNKIIDALKRLDAGGSTNGEAGIEQAYRLAQSHFIEGGVNRVILATDGDFNVGMTNQDALIELIEQKREKGIALTTLGFGQGNYNDYLMEQLADAGNGNYAYIDNINEARKVLVDELNSTMQIIAKDVKIQIEFNPQTVAEYRLIGYENRMLANEDFNNDKVDAGDIGAGHTVTALYELSLVGSEQKFIDDLRYKSAHTNQTSKGQSDELANIKLRYKHPEADTSKLISRVIDTKMIKDFDEQSKDFQFATAVAAYAQLLKRSQYTQSLDYAWVSETATKSKGQDEFGYRAEFIQLVRNSQQLALLN